MLLLHQKSKDPKNIPMPSKVKVTSANRKKKTETIALTPNRNRNHSVSSPIQPKHIFEVALASKYHKQLMAEMSLEP